jgi:CTP:molybdopterin cytidylyltransferase MocA
MIVGVLLAAGASSRMGSSKALVRLGGQSFLVRGVRALWSVCDTVIEVLGADGQRVCREVNDEFAALVERGLAAPDLRGGPKQRSGELELRFAFNPRWPQGMLSSARVGLAQALRHKPTGVLLMPVDQPDVKPATVQALGAMLAQALVSFGGKSSNGFAYGLVPRHRGQRGHPVALSSALADAVRRDRGARDLADGIRRNARLVGYLDVADKGVTSNRNTPAAAKSRGRR